MHQEFPSRGIIGGYIVAAVGRRFMACLGLGCLILAASVAQADVGDPQVSTNNLWYPGELACSTFERLQESQARVYEHVTGARPKNDQEKALAAWLWRNTHYAHGEEGAEDLWGKGFTKGMDLRTREYWTGMFAHGFGLCGTTHSQWTAEMEALFGHNRGRGIGVTGHNSFEVFLTGGTYGKGKWCLLDHDISTVIFDAKGDSLLSLAEVQKDWKRLTQRDYLPQKQHGWLVCGLHPGDGASYDSYQVAEYLSGYSGPLPMVHLRRGERLTRYLQPGFGKNFFVFWGRNYNTEGIPGPERSQTWVNQPEKVHGSKDGTGYHAGQARYGNASYDYQPNFADGSYKEGVISEDETQVTFEFYTPFIIGATPPNNQPWGVYEPGCKNGLIVFGNGDCEVAVSVDQGGTWQKAGNLQKSDLDLTDFVKGRRQYLLRFGKGAKFLEKSGGVEMMTVCQCNAAVLPRLKDGGTEIRFATSSQAVVSAGPNLPQAQAHVVDGKFGSPSVTLEMKSPRGEKAISLFAAAHIQSSNPPSADVKYFIDFSLDGGKSWQPVVKDWQITRRGDEPADFWSQSFCWGSAKIQQTGGVPIRIRFHNDGGKNVARAEAHLVYATQSRDSTRLTCGWKDDGGEHIDHHDFEPQGDGKASLWNLPTGTGAVTKWVELEPLKPQ